MPRKWRRLLAGAAAAVLAGALAARALPRNFAVQLRALASASHLDPASRRVATAPARFDRRYFVFLESARRTLPRGTRGVVLYPPGAEEDSLYMAAYVLAPLPVRLADAAGVPDGWVAAVYGAGAPSPGWRTIREIPGGALQAPAARAPSTGEPAS